MTKHAQGSPEWHAERLGKVTASNADVLLKDGKAKEKPNLLLPQEFSVGAETYAIKLLDELLTGLPSDSASTYEMQFGHEYEAQARAKLKEMLPMMQPEYAQLGLIEVPDFINHPTEPGIGCSPDALIGTKAGAEIKCRCAELHTRLLLEDMAAGLDGYRADVPSQNVAQVQFCLWVTQRELWFYVNHNPAHDDSTDLLVLPVERNERMIKKLETRAKIMRDCIFKAFEKFTGSDSLRIDMDRLTRYVTGKPFERIGMFHKEINT